jgi:allophanate hydrolase subunit 2
MHEGVPPGGALVPHLLARANAAADNSPDVAGLEIFGAIALGTSTPLTIASDDGQRTDLRAGDVRVVSCGSARVRYVAVRGGVAVPIVLGGRGTLLVAGVGGHAGRPLVRGDRLHVGTEPRMAFTPPALPAPESPIAVVIGPDLERFEPAALDALLGSEYRISLRSDRVGVRLLGPALPRTGGDAGISAPMVRGAIQVPSSGEPIVLGPDHPTMGGYPVLATVVTSCVGALMGRPPGAVVRFTKAATDS